MLRSVLVVMAVSLPLAAGCAAKKEMVPEAAVAPRAPLAQTAPVAASQDGILTGGLHISEEIVKACGLRATAAPPMFEFDSVALAEQDRTLLADLARCFSEGPMRGEGVALTGRADPRGEDEYNMALGESRADSVKRYLRDMGVAPQRVSSTSRGELDATGEDEDGWAKDRRVDIALAAR